MKNSSIWYKYDLANEKHMVRCVKQLEFMVRKSMSYDSWQKRSKYSIDMCPICGESFEFIRPETHHHPETLFTICERILQNHIDLNDLDDYTDFDICQEIMDAHFNKKVEYVVVCKHCHEKFHDNVPEILEEMDKAYLNQKKERDEFYTKEIKN
jgi:transcription elongation factor Elf1